LGAAEYIRQLKVVKLDQSEVNTVKAAVCAPMLRTGGFSPAWVTQVLQGFMFPYFILYMKHESRLKPALSLVEFVNKHLVPMMKVNDAHEWRLAQETEHMALMAEMILKASLFRTESRGIHFREDYPRRDDPTWLAWTKVREENGAITLYKQPVPKEWWPDLSAPYEERYPSALPLE
jgi:succinate dehydrogenase/fumarate reductase flavoprotein subunit